MKKLFWLPMMLMSVFTLASCGDSATTTTIPEEVTTTEDISTTTEDITKINVTSTCKLTRSHKNTTLAKNGIEDVTLQSTVDGDTTRFKGNNSNLVFTVRYLCIDTPESTQGYEKWGKAASVYNAEKLKNASSIVVECETTEAKTDGNGRYLCYVWYIPEGGDGYVLLNLQEVEEGFTQSGASSSTKYYDYFKKAQDKGKALKTRIYGDDEDIYYSEDVHEIDLKELTTNADEYYDKSTSIPKCVSFDAFIISTEESSSGFKTAVVEQTVDGVKYTYGITVGYSSGAGIYSIAYPGMYIHFVGWPDGSGSIHGCKMATGQTTGLWSYAKNGSSFYQIPSCTAVNSEEGYLVITGTYTTVLGEAHEITATYKGTDADASKYNGKTLTIFGYYEDEENPYNLTIYCKKGILIF